MYERILLYIYVYNTMFHFPFYYNGIHENYGYLRP